MTKKNYGIEKLVKKIFTKVFNETKEVLDVRLTGERKQQIIKSYMGSNKYNDFCKRASKELSLLGLKEQKKVWRNHYNSLKSKGVKLPPYYQIDNKVTKEVMKENFKFVKSIPENVLKLNKLKYLQQLQNQILEGTAHRKSLENMLKEMGVKYAKVISRTETSRLQTSIMEIRSKELGAKAYLWLSANDKRTRPSHRKMKNVIVFWEKDDDKKPLLDKMNGNAGEFPNCRCSTEPIFDFRDLPKDGMLDVYNYRKKKIVKMNRKEVESLLE